MKVCLDRLQIKSVLGPIVYMIHDASCVVYVGSSRSGIRRVFTADHFMSDWLRVKAHRIEIIPYRTYKVALAAEYRLIADLNPKLNKKGVRR